MTTTESLQRKLLQVVATRVVKAGEESAVTPGCYSYRSNLPGRPVVARWVANHGSGRVKRALVHPAKFRVSGHRNKWIRRRRNQHLLTRPTQFKANEPLRANGLADISTGNKGFLPSFCCWPNPAKFDFIASINVGQVRVENMESTHAILDEI